MRIHLISAGIFLGVGTDLPPSPPYPQRKCLLSPYRQARLVATARRSGWDADCDAGPASSDIISRIQAFAPDVVLLETSFSSSNLAQINARILRRSLPRVMVIIHGTLPSLAGAEVLRRYSDFDAGIRGDPEPSLEGILRRLDSHRNLHDIPGLMWREGESVHVAQEDVSHADPLSFAAPIYDIVKPVVSQLPYSDDPAAVVEISRGCSCGGRFCPLCVEQGRFSRFFPLDGVLADLEHCQQAHGIHTFIFPGSEVTSDPDYCHAFCEAIRSRAWDISWGTTSSPGRLTRYMVETMRRSGCSFLGLSAISGCQEILDASGTGGIVEDITAAVQLCRSCGIHTIGRFVFGLPGETPVTAEKTVQFAIKTGFDQIRSEVAVPYPGTPLGVQARERGWICSDQWSDFNPDAPSILDTGTITPRQVDYFRKRLSRLFHRRPAYFLRQLVRSGFRPARIIQASRFSPWAE